MHIINYFATGITARGGVSFLENNLQNLDRIIYVAGAQNKKSLTDRILNNYKKEKRSIEYIHSPYKEDEYEAIIDQTSKKAVVFDINEEQNIKEINNVEIFDYESTIIKEKLKHYKNDIKFLEQKKNNCLENAYSLMDKALKVHDEWEKIYIENMDFQKANELTEDIIKKLIGGNSLSKQAVIKDRYLGAATPEGAKDFIQNLTECINKRYFIKGRPGTGKSTILKKISKYAKNNGFDVEIYHCGFDPNSLDMLILRELSICIFDSTAPHEYFPDRENDEIIDVYDEAVKKDTDEKYSDSFKEIGARYKGYIKIATSHLKSMSLIREEIIRLYNLCTDFEKLEGMNMKILEMLED